MVRKYSQLCGVELQSLSLGKRKWVRGSDAIEFLEAAATPTAEANQ